MDTRTIALKGSEIRDRWRQKHKELAADLYMCDGDGFLISFNNGGRVVAYLALCNGGWRIEPSEAILIRHLLVSGVRAFDVNIIDVDGWDAMVKEILVVHGNCEFEYGREFRLGSRASWELWEHKIRNAV